MANTPLDLLRQLAPETPADALNQNGFGRPKTIVKSAIASYLASFFDERGRNRHLLAHACPSIAGMFDAGALPAPVNQVNQSAKNRLTIARLIDEHKADLPALLISDSGFTIKDHTLGGIDRGFIDPENGRRVLGTSHVIECGLSIYVASMDMTTTDDLTTAVAATFSTLRRFAGGNLIGHTDNVNWEIVLPVTSVSVPPSQHTPIDGDSKIGMYVSNVDISNIAFEAMLWWQTKYESPAESLARYHASAVSVGSTAVLSGAGGHSDIASAYPVSITDPGIIPLGQSRTVQVVNMPVSATLVSSNANVVRISEDPGIGFRVFGYRAGTAELRVVSPDQTILSKRSVEVQYRR